MKIEAILHIPLSKDAFAIEEKAIVVRLRTGKNDIGYCSVFYGDRVCMKEPIEVKEILMEKIASDSYFDYYEAIIRSEYTRVCYYFRIKDLEGNVVYYSEYGITEQINCHRTQYFQFPYIHRNDIIRAPEWTKDMVMYHIFPDSFASGKRKIEKTGKQITVAPDLQAEARNGGTIRGIIENLDYLLKLNINCIYLNPIFKAASYHKYDTIDYFEIDPCFGTKEEFRYLVQKCHSLGIRVILDGVFNHCGSGFFAFQDVLKNGEKSKYKNWFYEMTFPVKTIVPPNYEAFAYVPEMPKLNTANPEVEKYFCEVGRYWIRETDIDGWRLDVANEINHNFWRTFRNAVHEEKADAFMIGEIWEDSSIWLQGDQFDSTMNYTFSYICREFFAEKSIDVQTFAEKIHHMYLRYPEPVADMQMNFLDTHDVPRFLSYCNGNKEAFKLAVLFMMTAKGIPSVFYGDEMEIEGMTEETYRSPMPWEKEHEDNFISYYSQLIALRRKYKALQVGNYRTIICDKQNEIYGYAREYDKEKIYIIMNVSSSEKIIDVKSFATEYKGDRKIVCPAMHAKILEACSMKECM